MYQYKLYKITSTLTDEMYVDTTVLDFTIEMALLYRQALERKERGKNLNGLQTLMMERGTEHLKIELIEELNSESKPEKTAKYEATLALNPRLNKVVVSGLKRCTHGKATAFCRDCSGSVFCQHDRQKRACRECTPVYCEVCERTYAPSSYKTHIKSKMHARNSNSRAKPSDPG